MRAPNDLDGSGSWGARLLLVGGALLFSFAVIEAALRVLDPREDPPGGPTLIVASQNPRLVYELQPNYHAVRDGIEMRTNAAGFRDDEFTQERTPGVFRIAVVGDSVTFGLRVAWEEAYPQQLERGLRAAGHAVEVLSFGVPGYNSLQEVELVRTRVLEYAPDLLLVGYVLNDHTQDGPGGMERFFETSRSRALHWLWVRTRGLYRRLIWSVTSEAFEELAQLGSEHGLRVAIVIFPMMKFLEDGSDRCRGRRADVAEVTERVGFPTLDLFDAYYEAGFENVHLDRVHPNPRGHRLAAEQIRGFLEREDLIGPRRSASVPR